MSDDGVLEWDDVVTANTTDGFWTFITMFDGSRSSILALAFSFGKGRL